MLRKVDIRIIANILLVEIPRERVVVLPNAETFSLVVSDGGPGYEIAAHISCPSARCTSLVHKRGPDNVIPEDIFPTRDSWDAIVRQYTRSPVEEVALEIKITQASTVTCSLTFQSLDTTTIRLVPQAMTRTTRTNLKCSSKIWVTKSFIKLPGLSGITHYCPASSVFTSSIGLFFWVQTS